MTHDQLFDVRPERPGIRLHRLEVFNWGTFDSSDGRIYSFAPQGRTSLLVGRNGSGKSTLVDALLTLLVPAQIRNYNVAAGGKKTERNERSYVRGAYGRSGDEAQPAAIKYLRPKGNHLTALLAVFQDEQTHRAFTLCQVHFLLAEGESDRVLAIVDERRCLVEDLRGLQRTDQVRAHLQRLGYKTTKSFVDYAGWLESRTKMRSKAMDMFNQTVAVKDIQSLNKFIRDHMLEAHNWRDKLQQLLTHFNDLSAAHQELVRAKLAEQLLAPIERHGEAYRERSQQLQAMTQRLDAWETYYAVELLRLGAPELARRQMELEGAILTKDRLADELQALNEQIGAVRSDIEAAGGQRLRDLPHLIREQETLAASKQSEWERYHDRLRRCGIVEEVADASGFAKVRAQLQAVVETSLKRQNTATERQEDFLARRGVLRRQLDDEQAEWEILRQRTSNLPPAMMTLRNRMCADLQLSESVLPFAAELISVLPQERNWEASIEMVLRSFALSLLVPERFYPRVRAYVEQTKIANDQGEGQKLVYRCVGRASAEEERGDRLHSQSMFRKLAFRTGHDLVPWVRAEVLRRFDFRCCDSLEAFHEVERLGMTANRHLKLGGDRHEKDDRPRAVDPRHYVLGWDNREKRRLIADNIQSLQRQLSDVDGEVAACRDTLRTLTEQLAAADEALTRTDYDTIDFGRHFMAARDLRSEKETLESSNEAIRALQVTLRELQVRVAQLSEERDRVVMNMRSLEEAIQREVKLMQDAERVIARAKADGAFAQFSEEFPAIGGSLPEPLSVAVLIAEYSAWPARMRRQIENIRAELSPLADKLTQAMGRYLREFKEQQPDLDASVQALESFLNLLRQLRREDLPRYEQQFKDRLNDKVSQEVALLNAALRQECQHIEDKVRQLNLALSSLEYRPATSTQGGTYMRLEPREVNDREIADFRRSLRECLDESLENTEQANEARFLRIKKLVERLADKENVRWRDKVIDVRHWFDFTACEVQTQDGSVCGVYSDSAGQSGGEKAKLAFTILVAAIAFQYDIDPLRHASGRFHFVVVDEMFSKVDDQNAQYALRLFQQFGLQLLIVAPLDAKARITEPFVDCYLIAVKDEATHHSELYSVTAREYEEVLNCVPVNGSVVTVPATNAK